MKKIVLLAVGAVLACLSTLNAQEVAKRVIVEHFTNTRCGICANRNPGLIDNINSHSDILHMSVHPGSPFSSCALHQVNPSENNERTQYYNVYGGTPRIVIQGESISSSTNYSNASLFDDYEEQTTPVSLSIQQLKENGSISVLVTIRAEVNNTIGEAKLFLATAEKLVAFNAPNGEDEHHNVFRKTFNGEPEGELVNVPGTAGESLVIEATVAVEESWEFDELFTVVILQDAVSRSVIQAEASDPSDNNPLVNTEVAVTSDLAVFPNPVTEMLNIRLEDANEATYTLHDMNGRLLDKGVFSQRTMINMSKYAVGVYTLSVQTREGWVSSKVIK